MAVVVLFTTTSFTIDMHFCGNKRVDTAFFKKAKTCGMEMQAATTNGCSIKKDNCCSEKQVIAEGQDNLTPSTNSIIPVQKLILSNVVYHVAKIGFLPTIKSVSFIEARPPPLITPLYKQYEQYLI